MGSGAIAPENPARWRSDEARTLRGQRPLRGSRAGASHRAPIPLRSSPATPSQDMAPFGPKRVRCSGERTSRVHRGLPAPTVARPGHQAEGGFVMPRQKRQRDYFTSGDIAQRAGVSRPTINRYLRWLGLKRPEGTQHRFNAAQLAGHVGRLKRLNEQCPGQPLRAFPKELRRSV